MFTCSTEHCSFPLHLAMRLCAIQRGKSSSLIFGREWKWNAHFPPSKRHSSQLVGHLFFALAWQRVAFLVSVEEADPGVEFTVSLSSTSAAFSFLTAHLCVCGLILHRSKKKKRVFPSMAIGGMLRLFSSSCKLSVSDRRFVSPLPHFFSHLLLRPWWCWLAYDFLFKEQGRRRRCAHTDESERALPETDETAASCAHRTLCSPIAFRKSYFARSSGLMLNCCDYLETFT